MASSEEIGLTDYINALLASNARRFAALDKRDVEEYEKAVNLYVHLRDDFMIGEDSVWPKIRD
jgi:hypothetical protein